MNIHSYVPYLPYWEVHKDIYRGIRRIYIAYMAHFLHIQEDFPIHVLKSLKINDFGGGGAYRNICGGAR